jgi:hypothetical protein
MAVFKRGGGQSGERCSWKYSRLFASRERTAIFNILFICWCLQTAAARNLRSSVWPEMEHPAGATRDLRVPRALPADFPRISFTSETEIRTGDCARPNFLANFAKFALHHYVRLVTSVVRPEALLDRRK